MRPPRPTSTTGRVVNTATAAAQDPSGAVVRSGPASATSTADVAAALALSKTVAESSYASAGDVLHFTITAENTGDVTLTGVVVSDRAPGDGDFTTTCGGVSTLSPGEVTVCRAGYTVTSADVSDGTVTNTASAAAPGLVAPVTAGATSYSADVSPGSSQLPPTGARSALVLVLGGLALTTVGLGLWYAVRREARADARP